jgi:type IV pilus assembly protein PilE
MKKIYLSEILFLHKVAKKHFELTQIQSKKQSGFTLLELMITVVILTILATIAIPSYSSYITKSQAKSAASNLVALSLVVERNYLRTLAYTAPSPNPTTTTAETQTYATGWQPATDNFNYTVEGILVSGKMTGYTLTATGKTGTRNAGCTLTLTQTNQRTINGGSTCGGMSSW